MTLGGFVLDELGDIPDEGESVDFDGWNLRVHSMEKRRIAEVLVRRPGMTTPERPTEERP